MTVDDTVKEYMSLAKTAFKQSSTSLSRICPEQTILDRSTLDCSIGGIANRCLRDGSAPLIILLQTLVSPRPGQVQKVLPTFSNHTAWSSHLPSSPSVKLPVPLPQLRPYSLQRNSRIHRSNTSMLGQPVAITQLRLSSTKLLICRPGERSMARSHWSPDIRRL